MKSVCGWTSEIKIWLYFCTLLVATIMKVTFVFICIIYAKQQFQKLLWRKQTESLKKFGNKTFQEKIHDPQNLLQEKKLRVQSGAGKSMNNQL